MAPLGLHNEPCSLLRLIWTGAVKVGYVIGHLLVHLMHVVRYLRAQPQVVLVTKPFPPQQSH